MARCFEFQRVKAKHRHPNGPLQPFPILEWKWDVVTMDFITKLPRIVKRRDSITVVIDKLMKDAHIIRVKSTDKVANIA